jgi:hypothetical protein
MRAEEVKHAPTFENACIEKEDFSEFDRTRVYVKVTFTALSPFLNSRFFTRLLSPRRQRCFGVCEPCFPQQNEAALSTFLSSVSKNVFWAETRFSQTLFTKKVSNFGLGGRFLLKDPNENPQDAVQPRAIEHFGFCAQAWNKLFNNVATFNAAQEGRGCYGEAGWENAVFPFC